MSRKEEKNRSIQFQTYFMKFQDYISNLTKLASSNIISFCVDMHLIDAKCNNSIITSLFHFASTLATQNEIKKNQNVIIITLLQNVLQHGSLRCLNEESQWT